MLVILYGTQEHIFFSIRIHIHSYMYIFIYLNYIGALCSIQPIPNSNYAEGSLEQFSLNDEVNVTCDEGYVGGGTMFCHANNHFSPSTVECRPTFEPSTGNVLSHQKITTSGGFTVVLQAGDGFGISVTPLGDLNADLVPDMAVGAFGHSGGPYAIGALYIIFLQADGVVESHQKITSGSGGLTASLYAEDRFGMSCDQLDDLNQDAVVDLVVSAYRSSSNTGSVFILFLQTQGTVLSHQRIGQDQGGFAADPSAGVIRSVCSLPGYRARRFGDAPGQRGGLRDGRIGPA